MTDNRMRHADLTQEVIGACLEVMEELGTGFLESVYENALVIALRQRGVKASPQVSLSVQFRGEIVGKYIADIIVEDKVLLELKSVSRILPEHMAQAINYLQATGLDIGLVINFAHRKLEWKRLYRPTK